MIQSFNENKEIHGIVLQLPLADHLAPDFHAIVNSICKAKDLDCLNIDNYSNMMMFDKYDDEKMEIEIENLQHNKPDDNMDLLVALLGRKLHR